MLCNFFVKVLPIIFGAFSLGYSQSKTPEYVNPLKPEVYMGMPNLKDLAATEDLDKWTYIQDHLNGFWVNGAGTGKDRILDIVGPCASRNFIFVAPLTQRDPTFELSGGYYTFYNAMVDSGITVNEPSLAVVNDYITKQASNPQRYYMDGDLPSTTTFLENNNPSGLGSPFGERYYLTTRHGSFVKDIFNPISDPNDELVGQSYNTMLQASGIVYERNPKHLSENDNYKESYIQAFNMAHEYGKDFVWLCPRGNDGTVEELIQGLKDSYAWMAQNKVFPDKFVLANYTREENPLAMFPMIDPNDPEVTPPTFTGILYWAINEYKTNPENLLSNPHFDGDNEWFGQPASCYSGTEIRYDSNPTMSHTNDGSGSWIIECSSNNARIRNINLVTTPNTNSETATYQVSVWVKRETTNGEEAVLRLFLTEPGPTPSINIESNEGDYITSSGDWRLVTRTFEGVKRNTEYYINFNKKRQTGINADKIRVDDVSFYVDEYNNTLSSKSLLNKEGENLNLGIPRKHLTDDDLAEVEGFNLMGQKVFNYVGIMKELSTKHLSKGVYILKIFTNNQLYTKKILIQ